MPLIFITLVAFGAIIYAQLIAKPILVTLAAIATILVLGGFEFGYYFFAASHGYQH